MRPGCDVRYQMIVILVASVTYLGRVPSSPLLMDDTDGVRTQIARNVLVSNDCVTARLDSIERLEEQPLLGWFTAHLQKETARLVFSDELPVEELISDRLPLVRINEGTALALHPDEHSSKIIVHQQRWSQ